MEIYYAVVQLLSELSTMWTTTIGNISGIFNTTFTGSLNKILDLVSQFVQ